MKLAIKLLLAITTTNAVVFAQATTDAKQQFQQKCSICHGSNGKAATVMAKNLGAPDLTSEKVQSMKDAEIKRTIEKGNGKMPAYGSVLGPAGVESMLKFVRSLKSGK